jgi:hypothetical protein
VVRGESYGAASLSFALIHRSAWNRYSRKVTYEILHNPLCPGPVGLYPRVRNAYYVCVKQ